MDKKQDYQEMTKEELIQRCEEKDLLIDKCITAVKLSENQVLNKEDIMVLYHCESNKALRILRLMFHMGYGNKIGKEYYVTKKSLEEFMNSMIGKEVFI